RGRHFSARAAPFRKGVAGAPRLLCVCCSAGASCAHEQSSRSNWLAALPRANFTHHHQRAVHLAGSRGPSEQAHLLGRRPGEDSPGSKTREKATTPSMSCSMEPERSNRSFTTGTATAGPTLPCCEARPAKASRFSTIAERDLKRSP